MHDSDDWTIDSDGVEEALKHLMPRSAGLIIREAFYGTSRFDDFLARTGLTRSVLSTQLDRLVQTEMLQRESYKRDGERSRWEYLLTPRGSGMGVALIALIDWTQLWLPDHVVAVQPRHVACGARVHVELRCEHGHSPIPIEEVAAMRGASPPHE